MKYVETGSNYYHSVGYEYDQLNNLTSLVETINGTDYTTSYVYDDDNRVTSVTTNGTTVEYTYDAYGRISQQVTKRGDTTILTETNTYVGTNTTTSGQIATYKTETANYSVTYSYTYDDNGNILSVHDGTYATSYVYDSANQLIRENNQRRNRFYTWAYDNAGNILSQKAYVYTTGEITESTATAATNTYTYGDEDWGDLLTAYNGAAISYDEIGNPDGYSDRTFTWEHGRQLASQTKGSVEWEYTYNSAGLRTKRSSDSKTYEYVYSGDKLVQMTITDHTTSPETVQLMEFSYDAAGQPLTFTIDGVTYYYVLNIQGDVMGMVDGDGNLLYTMVYEGYGAGYYFSGGSAAATMLLGTNPLGYRGYVMDAGTGLYYLQSRYYDPEIGRFINADGYTSTGQGLLSNNMFAYCLNNPAAFVDGSGTYAQLPCGVSCKGSNWLFDEGGVEGAGLGGAAVVVAGIGFIAFCKIMFDEIEKLAKSIKKPQKTDDRIYSVYVLYDSSFTIRYVGRTKKVEARKNAHKNSFRGDLHFFEVFSNLSIGEARGLEQVLMLYCHTLAPRGTQGWLGNFINGINWFHPSRDIYLGEAQKFLDYVWNQVSNEALNWAGK